MPRFALILCSLLAMAAATGRAPQAAPKPGLEPAVDTSAIPAQRAAPPSAPDAAPSAAAPGNAPASAAPQPAGRKGNPRTAARANARHAPDRLQLDTTDITGNRELPKLLYIVPWKHAELGDLGGRPAHSLLDEVLQPLDRDVFRRQNRYYDALQPDRPGAKADAVQDSGGKP